ncbi:uncharacterized protein K489DRAFT_375646 [Dissoconium aciculare CBS 342.82]|jgi:hypothetical protein|uniref:Uncharacterized protein n=1 Tax=Dissoconium aciculare CBS 342.82 TaxID=1314786 RepID=A0A6J3MHW1_9PEZI|nr:uncharacterized protein K489DRAFT_375646 [Dissoconium aciculare CBS 342.82]KAF1827536.1 hypothetical protein K489DRAFT_375646 [Dissoconium aciculare CBS 342.82]
MATSSTSGGNRATEDQTSPTRVSRHSIETERRHLLSDDHSIAPSESLSQVDASLYGDGERTPCARSPTASDPQNSRRGTIADPATVPTISYRGYPSEAHYLAALRAWADSKRYVENDSALVGFYGQTTMAEYCGRPRVEFGFKKMMRERKKKRDAARETRRTTLVRVEHC